MTAAEVYVVEYGCDRHCRVEIDMDDRYHSRTTRTQMRHYADLEHDKIHAGIGEEAA